MTDIQISLTSLEEVFLNIAKNAELEEARSNVNAKPVDVPLPDGTILRVRASRGWPAGPLLVRALSHRQTQDGRLLHNITAAHYNCFPAPLRPCIS